MTQVTRTRKPKATAQNVLILSRYFIKRNGHVVSIVRSSNGVDTYQVLTINGVVNSCTCPAHKPCKHILAVQIAEDNRTEKKAVEVIAEPIQEVTPVAKPVAVQPKRETAPLYSRPFPGLPKSWKQIEEEGAARKAAKVEQAVA
jgi:hypothetical protein